MPAAKKAVAKKAGAEVTPAPAKVTTARKGSPGALVVLAAVAVVLLAGVVLAAILLDRR